MKALGRGQLSERAAEMADELLAACEGGGLAREVDFGSVHREEDEIVDLSSPSPPPPPADADRVPLHMAAEAAFLPGFCDISYASEDASSASEEEAVLRLRNPSRRQRLGAEIECKVWPSAIILGRWLWRHARLLKGRRVLECAAPSNPTTCRLTRLPGHRAWRRRIGSGVGACGLAASLGGAHRVVLTDINGPALALARRNAAANGDAVAAVTAVAHLDWSQPPILDAEEAEAAPPQDAAAPPGEAGPAGPAPAGPSEAEVASLLRGRFDVILAADVINDVGLSELVFEVVRLYLAPMGLFLMVCPKPRHRHTVERIRELLLDSAELSTHVAAVPECLREGIDEAVVVEHELTLVQWRDPSLVPETG